MTRKNRSLNQRFGLAVGILAVALAGSYSYSADKPAEEWKAPKRAADKKNPVTSDAASIAAGKKAYLSNCLACHGATGKGDGPAAAACNPKPKDLSDPTIVSQKDGELFWKVTEGKTPMPSYYKTLSETERWQVVTYIRTFVKQ